MNGSAEEMELFSQTSKAFKQIFHRQEIMKTFKTYDLAEVTFHLFTRINFVATCFAKIILSKLLRTCVTICSAGGSR